jgi:acyl-CoA synthetase (AMP-forming)/AMP-acid ligase II
VGDFGDAALIDVDDVAPGLAASWRPHEPSLGDIAFLQYTSGSTSAPKGVMITHGNLMANEVAIEAALSVQRDDTFVSWLPLFHDMGLIGGMLQPLHRGIKLVLMTPSFFLERPVRWLGPSRATGAPSAAGRISLTACVSNG